MSRRIKTVQKGEILEVLERGWNHPVELQGDAVPGFLGGLPEEACPAFLASGQWQAPMPHRSEHLGERARVAGMYVYRRGTDGRAAFKRDDYTIVIADAESETLWVEGPSKHPTEHWAEEIPAHLQKIEVIGSDPEADG